MCDARVDQVLRQGFIDLYESPVAAAFSEGLVHRQGYTNMGQPSSIFFKSGDCGGDFLTINSPTEEVFFTGSNSYTEVRTIADEPSDDVNFSWTVAYVPIGISIDFSDAPSGNGNVISVDGPSFVERSAVGKYLKYIEIPARPSRSARRTSWQHYQIQFCSGLAIPELLGDELQLSGFDGTRSSFCDTVMTNAYTTSKDGDGKYIEPILSYTNGSTANVFSCYIAHSRPGGDLPARLPVACFDANCSTEGYKTKAQVDDQLIGCSPALCASHINDNGTNISRTASIYCNGDVYSYPVVRPPDTMFTPIETIVPAGKDADDLKSALPDWAWGLVLTCIVLVLTLASVFIVIL